MVHGSAGLTVRVARILAPVVVLGPGQRVAVWVQGCPIACAGCASVDTWDPRGGTSVPVDDLVKVLADRIEEQRLDGVTLTGGEPTDQGSALAALMAGVRQRLDRTSLDVLVFTGRSFAAASAIAPELVAAADCVVAGPYRADRPAAGRLVASDNQSVHYRSAAVRDWYVRWQRSGGPNLELTADEQDLYLVGLPAAGDLDEFAGRLLERGVSLAGVSWRT